MQFEGGDQYPAGRICLALSLVGLLAVAVLWSARGLPFLRGLAVLLNVEGTILWASSLTPKGLVPPSSGRVGWLRWFLTQQGGVPLAMNQPMFYLGILFVMAGTIISSLAG